MTPPESNPQPESELASFAATPGSVVPFHDAELDRETAAMLINGKIYELPEGRRVEVWRVKDGDGMCIRIYRPTKDGKTSKLVFGLSEGACWALALGISEHLGHPPLPPNNGGLRTGAENPNL
jgi:hypothetical protein